MSPLLPPTFPVDVRCRRAELTARRLHSFDAAIVVVSVKDSHQALAQLPNGPMWQRLRQTAHRHGETPHLVARLDNPKATLIVIGFVKDDATPFACLSQGAKLAKEIGIDRCAQVALGAMGLKPDTETVVLEALLAATLAAAAPMPQFKSKPAPRPTLKAIAIYHTASKPKLDATLATHAGNHLARWLTTLPPNRLNCVSYARTLRTLAGRMRWQYRFIGESALKRLGAGAFLAVARANTHRGAGIVKLSYRPKAKARGHIALVGKGICFDTGGINLKPHKSMYHMHEDMQGSAVAVGTLLALTELNAPVAIDCWLALTENEIGPHAYRPQEVVTAANGVTIQIAHSDAEGRMVLADTLALAARRQNGSGPESILDFATLTGACIGALTERMSGVFTNRPAWHAALEQAGRDSGERVWPFPMDEDYDSDLDSRIADILQCTPDSKGDHILAARFLNRFVPKDIGWVHVDLAASNRTGGLAHIPTDFTGFGVRFAVWWLMHSNATRDTAK